MRNIQLLCHLLRKTLLKSRSTYQFVIYQIIEFLILVLLHWKHLHIFHKINDGICLWKFGERLQKMEVLLTTYFFFLCFSNIVFERLFSQGPLTLTVLGLLSTYRECKTKTDCTEHVAWSVIYTVHNILMYYGWNNLEKEDIGLFRRKIEIYFIELTPPVIFSRVAQPRVKIFLMVFSRWNKFLSFTGKKKNKYSFYFMLLTHSGKALSKSSTVLFRHSPWRTPSA